MRTAPGKKIGYIICPILIPPNADPERWLSTCNMNEGWQELGQILNALRAHDQRIEDNLIDLLYLRIPEPPEVEVTIVAVAGGDEKRINYREHEGPPGEAQDAVERVLEGKSTLAKEFRPISETYSGYTTRQEEVDTSTGTQQPPLISQESKNDESQLDNTPPSDEPKGSSTQTPEPTQIITGKNNEDGSIELRTETVARTQPKLDGTPGNIDIKKSKEKAKEMINKGKGIRLTPSERRENQRRIRRERAERSGMQMLLLSGLQEYGDAIRMNLLSKSGLTDNRTIRDLNILESSVREAAHHLESDNLAPTLDRHFGLDNLDEDKRKSQARRLHHSSTPTDERCHASPTHCQRALALKSERPRPHQERCKRATKSVPRMGKNHVPRFPTDSGTSFRSHILHGNIRQDCGPGTGPAPHIGGSRAHCRDLC